MNNRNRDEDRSESAAADDDAVLRDVARTIGPVPPGAVEAARAAFDAGAPGADVALLVFDSLDDASMLLFEEGHPIRRLVFRSSSGVEVQVDVARRDDGTDVTGTIRPEACATVHVRTSTDEVAEVTTDERGRFQGRSWPMGPVSLLVDRGRGSTPTATDWVGF